MDFSSRSSQQPQSVRPVTPGVSSDDGGEKRSNKRGKTGAFTSDSVMKLGSIFLLLVVAVLVAALAGLIYTSKPASQEKFINGTELQAVFLNNGQVYFGNVNSINQDYVTLTNVYYLQNSSTNQTSQNAASNQNVSLVKLGCELHAPEDKMIINTSQVTFWENLKGSGQVAQAVDKYKKTNPNGTCNNTTSNPTSTDNTSNSTTTPNNSTTTPNTTNDTTKKP